jgi:hypothetical protein
MIAEATTVVQPIMVMEGMRGAGTVVSKLPAGERWFCDCDSIFGLCISKFLRISRFAPDLPTPDGHRADSSVK